MPALARSHFEKEGKLQAFGPSSQDLEKLTNKKSMPLDACKIIEVRR
jgi:hypothetical protein